MDDILQDLSPENLITAIEDNLFSWIPAFGKVWEEKVNDPPGVIRVICDIPMSFFNSIMNTRLAPEQVEATILYLVEDAKSRNVPILWWVGPSTRPVDLAKYLEKYGFIDDEDGPGMAVDLANLNEKLQVPAGTSIQPAQDDESRLDWCRTMAAGFGIPEARIEFAVNAWNYLLSKVDPETTQLYIARLDGKSVATSLLQLGGGVAGIYSVTTIPEARRKGIGAQVTLHPLLQARAMGYKAGVIEASEMGLDVYRSIGFQEYCRVSSYVWRPTRE